MNDNSMIIREIVIGLRRLHAREPLTPSEHHYSEAEQGLAQMATLGLDEPAWLVETLVALVHATLAIAVSFTRNAKESKPDVRRLDDTRRLRRMEFGGACRIGRLRGQLQEA